MTRIPYNKLSTEDYVEIFKGVHGDRYDYSETVVSSSKEKVTVICKRHGPFLITPNSHQTGRGCAKCSYENRGLRRRFTTKQWVEKASKVHGTKYDYSKSVYVDMYTKIEIVCKEHGPFWQYPPDHVRKGCGCPKCKAETLSHLHRKPLEYFFDKFKDRHGDKYDYSLVTEWTSGNISVICPTHGEFKTTLYSHTLYGCKQCCFEARILPTEEFLKRSNDIHNHKYIYPNMNDYNGTSSIIEIVCPEHGLFRQRAGVHLSGCGCTSCAPTGFDRGSEGYVYVLQSHDWLKVGITSKTPEERCAAINYGSPRDFSLVFHVRCPGDVAIAIEKKVLDFLKSKYKQVQEVFSGCTETFESNNIAEVVNRIVDLERCYNG